MVLSHSQYQHLIKPKDKHGPRSTAELISSLGSISQLLSICLNTNLLFFTGKKREHQNNAVRSMLLGLFKDMIMQWFVNINYHSLSSVLLPLLSIVITSGFLRWCVLLQPKRERKRWKQPKNVHSSMKRKIPELGKLHCYHWLSFTALVFITEREREEKEKKNLYVGMEFSTVHEQQVFHVIPNSGKRF